MATFNDRYEPVDYSPHDRGTSVRVICVAEVCDRSDENIICCHVAWHENSLDFVDVCHLVA